MTDRGLQHLAARLIALGIETETQIATAESCTGGLIAGALTEIAGASAVFTHGFVTYSNDAKVQCLGVPAALIAQHGAVSAPVALAMARGARSVSGADLTLSVTGIAGPGGGSPEKPVGLVFFGVSDRRGTIVHRRVFAGRDRHNVRRETVRTALRLLMTALQARLSSPPQG
ncbi:hypothetical protein PB2503_09344 [Parvularcula bermudensis HTCC2503]|uniref:CinA C-terminal domain-containing protein n=1 Tax=Parvularcula bermudensis (strain ATCC BAA-594 / HTCC2503 / KCTC 12087) TaxID=314260 RepID=E0TD99_PARBH|nr:CinA family protein [Parvularcula bermudensis]ADM09922.1 hypothetical protein PB2503_09344 [Parvularcula bermudensis HTCC2503]